MVIQSMRPEEGAIPVFTLGALSKKAPKSGSLYFLSSHRRAKQSLDHGLAIRARGYNIFIIGDDGSHRLRSTLSYLDEHAPKRQRPLYDWAYVRNFLQDNEAIPLQFPAGAVSNFKVDLHQTMETIYKKIGQTLLSPDLLKRLKMENKHVEEKIQHEFGMLRAFAMEQGLDIQRISEDLLEVVESQELKKEETNVKAILRRRPVKRSAAKEDKIREYGKAAAKEKIYQKIHQLLVQSREEGTRLFFLLETIKKRAAKKVSAPYFSALKKKYEDVKGVVPWITNLEKDVLEQLNLVVDVEKQLIHSYPKERYGINVVVDQTQLNAGPVILAENPTYDALLGTLRYVSGPQGMVTDFTHFQGGYLHKANGRVLVIRAQILSENPHIWDTLKQALREEKIHFTPASQQGVAVEAPRFAPISLDIQVIILGALTGYYDFFYNDDEFRFLFKMKADIEPFFECNAADLTLYAQNINRQCEKKVGIVPSKEALGFLLGYSTRLSGHRCKVSTRCDRLVDLLDTVVKLVFPRGRGI